jgi:hypothetical protein
MQSHNQIVDEKNNIIMSEEDILKIIKHFFYPYVEIVDNKYIINIKCSLWDKCHDIDLFLNYYKNKMYFFKENKLISFDEIYIEYQTYCHAINCIHQFNTNTSTNTNFMIVSKHYFETYLKNQLADFIHFDTFITSQWFES